MHVVFPLFPGLTQLDFTGPHQAFAEFGATVTVASLGGRPIDCPGFRIDGLADLAAVPSCDILCVPGGNGATDAMADPVFVAEVRRLADTATTVVSVCTGALILGAAGLLKGRRAATHWSARDMLAEFGAHPDAGRVVRDGNVVTGGGVTAGIDVALAVIAAAAGADAAQTVQLVLEYAPEPPFDAGRPETAPQHVVDGFLAKAGPRIAERRRTVARVAAGMRADAPAGGASPATVTAP